jgi:hypothetical protein
MRFVEVKDQVRPPLGRCIELVLSGIKYRMFRAGITVAIISLAVAFLMTMLCESLITRQVGESIDAQTAPRRLLQFWVGRFSTVPDWRQLNEVLAGLTAGSERWKELAAWGKLTDDQLARLANVAGRQQVYTDFLDKLSEGDRRVLAERVRGEDIFTALVDRARSGKGTVYLLQDKLTNFQTGLSRIGKRYPTSLEEFENFLRDWYATTEHRAAITRRHEEAIANLSKPGGLLHGRRPTEFLASADPGILKQLAAEGIGFRMTADELETARREAALSVDADKIERMLSSAMLKAGIASRFGEKVTEVNVHMLFTELGSRKGAESFVDLTNKTKDLKLQILTVERLRVAAQLAVRHREKPEPRVDAALLRDAEQVAKVIQSPLVKEEWAKHKKINENEVSEESLLQELANEEVAVWLTKLLDRITPLQPLGLSVERVQEVAKFRLARSRLAETEASVSQMATRSGLMGFSGRTIWLLVVSFLVCVVGIANAMLMSVTERFREIATMKCLGATDGFIMISFVLESCMQGIVGSIIGLAIGLALGIIRTWAAYGWLAVEAIPALNMLTASAFSLVLGVLISALAAVYPAWVAARLAPMEAMRIE